MQQWVVATTGCGFIDLTARLQAWLAGISATQGLVTLFVQHTSASLTVQENSDPDVLRDLADALQRAAPRRAAYRHSLEGEDDMPAHIKAMLTLTSLAIPVSQGRAMLGQWQAIYLIEHRDNPQQRHIALHYCGDTEPGAR